MTAPAAPPQRVLGVAEWLGPRLGLALELLGGPWGLVADVACDHARLGLGALASGQARAVLASDLAAEPLAAGAQRAFEMVAREDAVGAAWRGVLGLPEAPTAPAVWPSRQGDALELGTLRWRVVPGLGHLKGQGVEALAMCGIGAQLAVRLLEAAQREGALDGLRRVVLLPHWSTEEPLAWAARHGWRLAGQGEVRVKGRRYPGLAFDAPEGGLG